MSFFDKKVQKAQDETEKLINDYRAALNASPEIKSIRTMVSGGAPATSIADRAVNIHKGVFNKVMAGAPPKLLKETRRVEIIEQFCLSLWGRYITGGVYQELLKKLEHPVPKR